VALLRARWAQVKDGLGQVILLSGEAGIGKSRLVQALQEHVAAEPQAWLTPCQCSPYYKNTALYPMIGLLERVALRFDREESPQQKLHKLEGFLRNCSKHCPDPHARCPFHTYTASPCGLASFPRKRESRGQEPRGLDACVRRQDVLLASNLRNRHLARPIPQKFYRVAYQRWEPCISGSPKALTPLTSARPEPCSQSVHEGSAAGVGAPGNRTVLLLVYVRPYRIICQSSNVDTKGVQLCL
jgi:hypothetical protein